MSPVSYLPVEGDKVSMLTHIYPHKLLRRIKATICNHQADSQLCVWPDVGTLDMNNKFRWHHHSVSTNNLDLGRQFFCTVSCTGWWIMELSGSSVERERETERERERERYEALHQHVCIEYCFIRVAPHSSEYEEFGHLYLWRHITQQKNTIHQVTTMLTTSKNVLFLGHNHLLSSNRRYWWADTLIIDYVEFLLQVRQEFQFFNFLVSNMLEPSTLQVPHVTWSSRCHVIKYL